jgi:hypothetical protein
VNFTGAARMATTVNGLLPGPTLRWREGTTVTLRVTNRLRVPTSIHWHGIILPADMDGVPGLSFPRHRAGRNLHLSVSGAAERHVLVPQSFRVSGANRLVRFAGDRSDAVRSDSRRARIRGDAQRLDDENPSAIFAHLKKMSDYYNRGEPTARDFLDDVSRVG